MRFSTRLIVIASVVLASAFVSGQETAIVGGTSPLLVRMSFTSFWAADYGPEGMEGSPRICFSVNRNGHYLMRRLTTKVSTESLQETPHGKVKILLGTPHTELLQGTLSSGELEKLKKLLEDPDFRKLTGSSPRLLLKGAETFVAEVPREDGVQRVVRSDADGENPLPRSAERIVNWLQHFKADGAEPLDVSDQDICPSGAIQPLHPATALLQPSSSSGECGKR